MFDAKLFDRRMYLLRYPHGAGFIGIWQQYGELFTTKTGDKIGGPVQSLLQLLCHLNQTLITCYMAVAVIKGFKVVNIQHQ